jgi:hypothetical protein
LPIWVGAIKIMTNRSLGPFWVKGHQGQDKHWNGTNFEKIKEITFFANDTTVRMFEDYLTGTKADGIKVF